MIKFKGYKKFVKEIEKAVTNYKDSAGDACKVAEDVLIERTNQSTPSLSNDLINSRKFILDVNKNYTSLTVEYKGVPYAIEQHEAPYNHDYSHNPAEVRAFRGGTPLRYLARPLIDERDVLWKRIAERLDFK